MKTFKEWLLVEDRKSFSYYEKNLDIVVKNTIEHIVDFDGLTDGKYSFYYFLHDQY